MSNKNKRELETLIGRRALIKWSLFTGAALGVPRWKIFEVLEHTSGRALAQAAACSPTNRSIHIIAGNGGMANFQLLWPHNEVAAANAASSALLPGTNTVAAGTTNPLTLGPNAPWKTLPGNKQVTAILGGTNQTHTAAPNSTYNLQNGSTVFAAAAALQKASPTLVPVVAIGNNTPYGAADGAPALTRSNNAQAFVNLFNSAASQANGILNNPANASLYKARFDALASLRSAAGTSTMRGGLKAGSDAANLLGINLSTKLAIAPEDLARYGLAGNVDNNYAAVGQTLIVAAKAFALGLTNSVIMPGINNDPHGGFNNVAQLQSNMAAVGQSLDAFMADLMAMEDPTCAGKKIGDNVVISIHGDTPKDPLDRNGWPDGTPNGSNWIYVLGGGYLKTGWFGGINAQGNVSVADPATGAIAANRTSGQNGMPASAAVLYAVAKGDIAKVSPFFNGNISGFINSSIT